MSRIRWPLSLLSMIMVGGCAWAPGVFFDKSATAQPLGGPGTTAPSNVADSDRPPEGALQDITPEFIRTQRQALPQDVGADVRGLFAKAAAYRIGPGDILNIVVWDHPELSLQPAGSLTTDAISASPVSNGYNVSQDGLIQFPYVGSFKVGGLTEYEVRDGLLKKLSRYFSEPKLTVRVQSYRHGRVYVDGAVRTPGLQAVNDVPMTLPEAINRAGGFAPDADRSAVAVSRAGKTTMVNLPQMVQLGVNPTQIMLAPGDMVRVFSQEDAKVYLLGEVLRPAALPMRNGRMTLNQALGEVGGVSTTSGDPRQIYVVRAKNGGGPDIFHLDASTPASYALAEAFELQARDVVYVDAAALVRWSRVINLILPSAQVMNVGNEVLVR